MNNYITFHRHHIGTSHIRQKLDCEDYSASCESTELAISVISDGHGDKNCFRSAKGAQLACEISISLCQQFFRSLGNISGTKNCQFDNALQSLEQEIVRVWRDAVIADIRKNPLTEDELSCLEPEMQDMYRQKIRLEKIYGCTLIVAVISQYFWFGLQIGDGSCVAVYEDGAYINPVPSDPEHCYGNVSTSLCNTDAVERFRHYYSDVVPLSVFVFSDGVEESFDESGLHNCFFAISSWFQRDREMANKQLADLLPQISQGGSGDDVSIAGIVARKPSVKRPKQTLSQFRDKLADYKAQLSICDDELQNTKKEIENAEKEHAAFETEAENIRLTIEELQNELSLSLESAKHIYELLSSLRHKSDELAAKRIQAQQQYDELCKQQSQIISFWKSQLSSLGLWNRFEPEYSSVEENVPVPDMFEFPSPMDIYDNAGMTETISVDQVIIPHRQQTDSVSLEEDFIPFTDICETFESEGFNLPPVSYPR